MALYTKFLISLLASVAAAASGAPLDAQLNTPGAYLAPEVPFYSQFADIQAPKWQKIGCGIASLAMLVNFYQPDSVSADTLLNEGIAAGAYINGAGWSHKGLAQLAQKHGLASAIYNFSKLDSESAFAQFEEFLKAGPVIASVHYKLDPKNPIPHLIVINGIGDGMVYFNDPAGKSAGGKISVPDFIKAWKKKFIVVRNQKLP